MTHVSQPEIQQWLERTKLTIESPSEYTDLETTAVTAVFSALKDQYAVDTWVSEVTTPDLVRKILSMLVASWIYRRSYTDQARQVGIKAYDDWLESLAYDLLGGLVSGSNSLEEGEELRLDSSYPGFWPTDEATALGVSSPEAEGAAFRAFDMGKVF